MEHTLTLEQSNNLFEALFKRYKRYFPKHKESDNPQAYVFEWMIGDKWISSSEYVERQRFEKWWKENNLTDNEIQWIFTKYCPNFKTDIAKLRKQMSNEKIDYSKYQQPVITNKTIFK